MVKHSSTIQCMAKHDMTEHVRRPLMLSLVAIVVGVATVVCT